jgi:putative flavoprotein involved in K+ transport
MRTTDTLVIGAGQAGLAMSRELTAREIPHAVLERDRVGARWHERWESLNLLTPNWLNLLPGAAPHDDPDGFLGGRAFAHHLADYAESIGAPVEEGAEVLALERAAGGFHVETAGEDWHARHVVLATGDCDVPRVPGLAEFAPAGLEQMHTLDYRHPHDLPPGGVLVVGAGASGLQIALELRGAGRDVVLAAGRHNRMVRTHQERDIWTWLMAAGHADALIEDMPDPRHARRAGSFGLAGGREIDLGVLSAAGVTVTGRLRAFAGSRAVFADDLAANLEQSDASMRRVLARVGGDPDLVAPLRLPAPPAFVDLHGRGIRTILWATGFRREYPWLRVPVLDGDGEISQHHGVTPLTGLYTLGLRFQRKRKSHTIGGVGEDAALLAARIAAAPRAARARLAVAA